MTYSIVARDPATGALGGAVQTRWFNVGAGVLWAEPGVGAIATQSFSEPSYGPVGLDRLRGGESPAEALAALLAADPGEAVRQVGMVDARGRSAAHTGSRCVFAAGHVTGPDVSIQANMMERPSVWPAMRDAFAAATGDLADRLMAALVAAEAEGGDVRGRQSAALLVVPGGADAKPWSRTVDVRVEDHDAPNEELARLLRVARAYDAFDAATDLATAGDPAAAVTANERALALAPDDDQLRLWHAVFLAGAGRLDEGREAYRRAVAVEPRGGEHLRRFLAAGHLPAEVAPLLDALQA
jgi:uncharacterized Ntn-hydrolase superfamily protein